MAETVLEILTTLVKPIVEELHLEFVELQYRQEQHGWVIRIIIYAEGGITIEHCQNVSREVSYLLDVEDIISRKYHLEVTSPGLDRPLQTPRDFARNIDRKVAITLIDGDNLIVTAGTIIKVENDDITLRAEHEEFQFHYTEVKKAKLSIDFSKPNTSRKKKK